MNSLGDGVKKMRLLSDIEKVAHDLQNGHTEGSIGHVLGGALLDVLNSGRYEPDPKVKAVCDMHDEYTEGAPETAHDCKELERSLQVLRSHNKVLEAELKEAYLLRDEYYKGALETMETYKALEKTLKEERGLREEYRRGSVEVSEVNARLKKEIETLQAELNRWKYGNLPEPNPPQLALTPPHKDVLDYYRKEGLLEDAHEIARVAVEYCRVPLHLVSVLETFFHWHAREVAENTMALRDMTEITADNNAYQQGINDSARRLRNVLDREGLLPADCHPEDRQ